MQIALLLTALPLALANDADQVARLRRPVAIAVSPDDAWLYVANRTGSVTIVDLASRAVAAELEVGGRLTDLAVFDERHLLALDDLHHELLVLSGSAAAWQVSARLAVAPYPSRLIVDRTLSRCLVSSLWSGEVTTIDCARIGESELRVAARTSLDFEPRELAFASGRNQLIVAGGFAGRLAMLDADDLTLLASKPIPGHNIRGMAIDKQERWLLVAQQELNPLGRSTRDDVHWGNVISNQLVAIALDDLVDPAVEVRNRRVVSQLGEPGRAAGDPGPLALLPGGGIAVALSGVNEVALGNASERGVVPSLWNAMNRFAVGSRPVDIAATTTGTLLVANQFSDSITWIESTADPQARELLLGPPVTLNAAEVGERLFFDSRLSHDGWMSCHSCHTEGHTSGQLADNLSDGTLGTPKRVLTLLGVRETAPWGWNGKVLELADQVASSITTTMQGQPPRGDQVAALDAFLRTLSAPVPPPAALAVEETEIRAGQQLFAALNCQRCHQPPNYTSGGVFDVGLRDEEGEALFNPPSLRGVGRRGPLFHDGRASSLRDLLTVHRHQLDRELSAAELRYLLSFLMAL